MEDLTDAQKNFAKSIAPLRFLIIDPSSGRKTMRKLLSHFQIKPAQIEIAERFEEGELLIREKKPHVIFADQDLDGRSGIDLVAIHKEMMSADLQVFFLSTTQDSAALVSVAAEESVDCLLLKPLTFGGLMDRFEKTLAHRLHPTAYEKALKTGQTLLNEKKFNEALIQFESAALLDLKPVLALARQGEALTALQQTDKAKAAFEKGLKIEPTHFRCLLGSFELQIKQGQYAEAYVSGQKLAAHHTVPLKYIPDLIRVSIGNQVFTDVLDFYKDADALIQVNPYASLPLAAGLVVCGLYHFRKKDKKSAMDAFRKAEVCARGNPKILKRILVALISEGHQTEASAFLARIPAEVKKSPDVQMAELELLEKTGASPADLLRLGLQLIHEGVVDLQLYLLVIRKSKAMSRSEKHTDSLVQIAISKFPQHREVLEKER